MAGAELRQALPPRVRIHDRPWRPQHRGCTAGGGMSTPAPIAPPPSDTVTITVDGVPVKAKKGEMLIRVTDANDVYVPRFCYHEKLAVAANCRMCLVDVEKAPKPMPACATP